VKPKNTAITEKRPFEYKVRLVSASPNKAAYFVTGIRVARCQFVLLAQQALPPGKLLRAGLTKIFTTTSMQWNFLKISTVSIPSLSSQCRGMAITDYPFQMLSQTKLSLNFLLPLFMARVLTIAFLQLSTLL